MKIKRFFAKDMRTALHEVKAVLGADAVIMSNKRVNGGVEIVAAIDPDARRPEPVDAVEQVRQETADELPADSLQSLLQRQAQRLNAEPQAATDTTESPEPAPLRAPENSQISMPEMVSNGATTAQEESASIAALRAEMADIKSLLKHQVSGLLWQEVERNEPTRAMLIKRLRDMGLAEHVADQLSCFIPETEASEEAWEHTLHILQGQVHTTRDDILTHGGIVALVGPTGVGKTTTIAKLAARFAQLHGKDQVAMISTDTYRIGATEQLQTYGRIIGCPVKVAKDARELSDILLNLRQKKLVLIDTAGMGQRDMRLSEQLNTLMSHSRLRIRPYLCLAATAQMPVLQDILRQFQSLPLAGCILTKLDECLSLGEALSVAIEHALPVSYVTDGQQVPEDIKAAEAEFLVTEAERLYEKTVCSKVGYMPSSEQRNSSGI